MSDYIIKVENLGKKYSIQHQGERERYVALRDVLARKATAPLRWLRTRNAKGKEQSAERLARSASLDGNGSSPPGLGPSPLALSPLPHANGSSHSAPGSSPLPLCALPKEEEFWALRGVNFEVKQGEVVGIIGRNGAGKSTLLKILSRITKPTEGRVRIRGRVASLLEVGTGFHPELTGRENIFLNGTVLGMTREEIRKKFDEIVAFAEVEKFLDTPVKRYSSGMSVRLAFAVAAHLDPEILIVDEVLAVGDAAFQKKCLGKMDQIAHRGRTVLFVSHVMNSIERLCHRVVVLEGGRMLLETRDVRVGIMTYLKGNYADSSQSWCNERGEFEGAYFVPHQFMVSTEGSDVRLGEPFLNSHPLTVTVRGYLREVDPAFNVGIYAYAENGEILLCSMLRDVEESRWIDLYPGPVAFQVRLPARWLNEGNYRLELVAGLHCRSWLLEPGVNAPTVKFSIKGGLSDSPLWDFKRAGLMAPVFEWTQISNLSQNGTV